MVQKIFVMGINVLNDVIMEQKNQYKQYFHTIMKQKLSI